LQLASNNGTVALTIATNQEITLAGALKTAGNLGVGGVTLSPWSAQFRAIQVSDSASNYSSFGQRINSTSDLFTGWNVYNDSTGTASNSGWKYTKTGDVAALMLQTGAFVWYSAPSGTAGNAITFTENMRIDSGGIIYAGGSTNATANGTIYSKTTARAWCFYDGVTQSISGSFNISSVTYNAAGDYTFNLTTAVSSATGALLASKSNQVTNAGNAQGISWSSTSAFGLVNYENNNKVNSPVYVVAFA
jgi:hypothetical protein